MSQNQIPGSPRALRASASLRYPAARDQPLAPSRKPTRTSDLASPLFLETHRRNPFLALFQE